MDSHLAVDVPGRRRYRVRGLLCIALLSLVNGCSVLCKFSDGDTACQVVNMWKDVAQYTDKGDPLVIGKYRVPRPRPRNSFSAGVGIADITPPPGFPTGGDGPAGDVARGYWLRLHSRAFFFEDDTGHTLALVTADLFGVPAAMREYISKLIARRHPDVSLPPASLILAANHTHQSPGNFMSARLHNQFGSAYPGFDRALFEFLAQRIAASLSDAIVDARSHHGDIELEMHSTQVGYDLLLNRAPKTFVLNRDRDVILEALNHNVPEPQCSPGEDEAEGGWQLLGCPRLRAADRALSVLHVRRHEQSESRLLGAMVFFAAHPTVLDPQTPFYSSDFSGYAMRVLESRMAAPANRKVVVGFFNGAEGDITLRRTQRDLLAARNFGVKFAGEVLAAAEKAPLWRSTNPKLSVRAGEWFPSKPGGDQCGDLKLAVPPMVGTAMLGGAENDHTQLYQLGWREGVRDNAVSAQGVKLPALDTRLIRGLSPSKFFMPADAFPESIPLTHASLGPLQVAAVPTEMTTAQGFAVRQALKGLRHGNLELIGLANEYDSYCSSHDEYAAQDYMGASTLWGPDEGPYLACQLGELAQGHRGAPTYKRPEREFWPGAAPAKPFGPSFVGEIERPDEGLDIVLLNRKLPERKLPWFAWTEQEGCNSYDQTVRRHVSIVMYDQKQNRWTPPQPEPSGAASDGPSRPEDDHGVNFLTMYLGKNRWAAIWLRPLFDPSISGAFAFQVASNGATRVSVPFAIQSGKAWPDQIQEDRRPAR